MTSWDGPASRLSVFRLPVHVMKQFVVLYVSLLVAIQILLTTGFIQPLELPISQFLAAISAGIIKLFGTDVVHQGIVLRHGDRKSVV